MLALEILRGVIINQTEGFSCEELAMHLIESRTHPQAMA
jgi:hypothetical protein